MKIIRLFIITFFLFGFAPYPRVEINDDLLGTWVYSSYDDELLHYEKKNKFDKDKPGIEFKTDGTISKRQNVGWCGTPPITYGDFDGVWTKSSDSTLLITYKYWGGKCKEEWQIASLEKEKLVAKRLWYKTVDKNTVERDR